MRAIAFDADACVAIIAALLHQLRQDEAQLHQLNARLDAYCGGGIIAEATPPSSPMLAPPPLMENNTAVRQQCRLDMADGIPQGQGHRHFLLDTTTGDQLSIQHDYDEISPILENKSTTTRRCRLHPAGDLVGSLNTGNLFLNFFSLSLNLITLFSSLPLYLNLIILFSYYKSYSIY